MLIPEYVLSCLNSLENKGFPCYAVGGCVRDALLGLTPHDYDLCTAATPAQIKEIFSDHDLVLAGEKHGTVGVITPEGVVEITTFRTEGDYLDNRHPDTVTFVTDIRQDLARRDFTVNAMAYSPTRGLADPFGGQADLNNKILRAVGDAGARFTEDSLRILRGVRFAVRFRLTPEPATERAMTELAPLMENLARERVFSELCQLLTLATAEDLLRFAPVLTQVIPELKPTIGFRQHSQHHIFDVFTHTAHVTEAVCRELPLRWAALLHDLGKPACLSIDENGEGHFYGHASVGAQLADRILLRLKAPTALRERVVFLVKHHMDSITQERKPLRRLLSRYGEEALQQLMALQTADFTCKGVCGEAFDFAEIKKTIAQIVAEESCLSVKDLAVDGHDMMALGITGPAIGRTLNALLDAVLEETLPNEREALIQAAKTRGKHYVDC
ncbi:MAG: HD domain-containing protein [Oscillospiraceae bacterium]|nr:HD domain-containing protein [Oscillospiraceae bacterium]MBQ9930399.1 HD domain-containing protein [Oscillospiraceae bacterium]